MVMEPRNGKRSPGRASGRRSSERQGRRCRTRSRTPIQRRRSSRYSPTRRRTRSRSLSPYRSRDYYRGQRSSSSESRRKVNDDVRRPQFRGPENSKVLEKAERDRTRIIVYQNESASYDSKFDTKRLASRERNRVTTNGNEYPGRRAYDRSSTSRDRSPSPLRRNHELQRNSDGKNYGRDYEYDRNYFDKLERPRGSAKERLRLNSSRRRTSRDHRAYEKYDDKKSTYKRAKDGRHEGDAYSKNKEQESENNEVENIDGSDESNENEEGGQSSSSDTVLPQAFPNMFPVHLPRMPMRCVIPVRQYFPPRPLPPLPYLRYPVPFGMPGLIPRPPILLRPYPPRYFVPQPIPQ